MTYRIKHTRKRLLIIKEKNLLMTIDMFFLHSLRLDIQRAVNDASMASIFESIIWFDQQVSPQISLLDTMFTDMRGAELFAVALLTLTINR